MKKKLETERLILRPFEITDIEDTYQLIYGDPRIKWGGEGVDWEGGADRVKYFMDRASCGPFFNWAVVRKADNQFIGMMAFESDLANYIIFEEAPDDPYNTIEVELGYVLGRDYWDQGYATEAGRAIVDYAFEELKLRRIVSLTSPENKRSLRVMEKLGNRFEKNLHPDWTHRVVGILENPHK